MWAFLFLWAGKQTLKHFVERKYGSEYLRFVSACTALGCAMVNVGNYDKFTRMSVRCLKDSLEADDRLTGRMLTPENLQGLRATHPEKYLRPPQIIPSRLPNIA